MDLWPKFICQGEIHVKLLFLGDIGRLRNASVLKAAWAPTPMKQYGRHYFVHEYGSVKITKLHNDPRRADNVLDSPPRVLGLNSGWNRRG